MTIFGSAEREVQLEFRCPSCGLAGLTPEVTQQEAVCLARGELEIRCPKCGAILGIRADDLELLAGSRAVSLLQESRKELEQVLLEALEQGKKRDGG